MNKSITQATQNDKQISKSIKRFFTRFHVSSALKLSNAYKKKGIPCDGYVFLVQCTACDKTESRDIELFNKAFNYIDNITTSGMKPSEDMYLKYVIDCYGVDEDWRPPEYDKYPYWYYDYLYCRYNYVIENDIDGDGTAETILYGRDGSGSEFWDYLAFYDDVRAEWIHMMPIDIQEPDYDIKVSYEQREWIKQSLKQKKLGDEETTNLEAGLMYMYPIRPAVLEDGSVLVTFYGRNDHEVFEDEYIVLDVILQYRWSEELDDFELINYALLEEKDNIFACSDKTFLKELAALSSKDEK